MDVWHRRPPCGIRLFGMAAIVWIAAAVILPLVMLGDVAVGAPVSLLPASPASAKVVMVSKTTLTTS